MPTYKPYTLRSHPDCHCAVFWAGLRSGPAEDEGGGAPPSPGGGFLAPRRLQSEKTSSVGIIGTELRASGGVGRMSFPKIKLRRNLIPQP